MVPWCDLTLARIDKYNQGLEDEHTTMPYGSCLVKASLFRLVYHKFSVDALKAGTGSYLNGLP